MLNTLNTNITNLTLDISAPNIDCKYLFKLNRFNKGRFSGVF